MKQVPTVETDYGGFLLPENIGLSEIPLQLAQEAKEKGFVLNILAVGRRCLGTSTLINALFAAPLVDKARGNGITTTVNEIEEDGVRLRVSVTTYHEDDYDVILKVIDERYKEYYVKEQGLSGKLEDKRFHVCFFAIPLDSLRPEELTGISAISKRCNLIPIITRADTYVEDELEAHKKRVYNQLVEYGVDIFRESPKMTHESSTGSVNVRGLESELAIAAKTNPEQLKDEDTEPEQLKDEKAIMATIASERTYDIGGSIIRGRKYPWGFIDTTNESYSDFRYLQRMIIQTSYDDLLWTTDSKFYNDYRKNMSVQEQPALQKKRLTQLLEEMGKILKNKHQMMVEELRREEQQLDEYFPSRVGTPSGNNEHKVSISDSNTLSEGLSHVSVSSINRNQNNKEATVE